MSASTTLLAVSIIGIGIGKIGLSMFAHLRCAVDQAKVYERLPANALQSRVLGFMMSKTLVGAPRRNPLALSAKGLQPTYPATKAPGAGPIRACWFVTP